MARIIKKINTIINERGIITIDIKIIIRGILITICISLVTEVKNTFRDRHNWPEFRQQNRHPLTVG